MDPWVLTTEGSDSTRVFSVKKPTRSDFATFQRAIITLTSDAHRLPTALGAFINDVGQGSIYFTYYFKYT